MGRISTILKVFLSCHLLLLLIPTVFSQLARLRIVDGATANLEQVPYLVQVWKNEKFLCGGTRASSRHIITAAHCVYGATPNQFTIVAGAARLTDKGTRSKVAIIKIHPEYTKATRSADVAVMILKSELRGPSLVLPRECKVPMQVGDEVQIFGWGRSFEYVKEFSNELQTANLKVIAAATCQKQYGGSVRLRPSMFCAGAPGKDTCNGDSGGPILSKGQFCGIISFGNGCARPGYASVNVHLEYVRPFLSSIIMSTS